MTLSGITDLRRKVERVPLNEGEPRTLGELFVKAVREKNRTNALNYKQGDSWKAISSDEMMERAGNIALGLYSLGLRKGDRVALLAANSPEWTMADAGCQLSGVIDVPIYTTLTPSSVEYILNDSGARAFIIEDRATFDRLRAVFANCPHLEKLIFFKFDESIDTDDAVSLSDLETAGEELRKVEPGLLSELTGSVEPSDVATLIYTSGTTGEPKGVMLTQGSLVSNVIDAGADFAFAVNDISLSVLPLSHVFERTGMYLYIHNGMSVYYAESVDKAPENLREVRPTIFVGVPRIFEKVYQKAKLKASEESRLKETIFDWAIRVGKEHAYLTEHKKGIPVFLGLKYSVADRLVFSKLRAFFGGRLRACITGGAALSDDINYIFNAARITIMQGYGLTETAPVITTNTLKNVRVGTVGKPIRNVVVRIASDGEIEVSGPNLMLGYYNKPEATRDAFTEDGWFKTGDIGELSDDGFLKITDRKKELFKTSGGKYIAPAHIEQMIKASKFVNQVVLIGNERRFPAALIVPNFEPLESYAKIKNLVIKSKSDFCTHPRIVNLFERQVEEYTKGLAQFEKVKKIALLQDELTIEGGELTPTLKVKRRVVDEKYRDIIEKIYAEE